MYLELGLVSICLSGVGIYALKTVKREDVENCFRIADMKVTEFELKIVELATLSGEKISSFIEQIQNELVHELEKDEQEEQEELTVTVAEPAIIGELSIESDSSVELELKVEKSPRSVSSEGERTLDSFILLSEENTSSEELKSLLP